MIVYLVAGVNKEDLEKCKPKNNAMFGFYPVFKYLPAAEEYAKEYSYPIIKIDTNSRGINEL